MSRLPLVVRVRHENWSIYILRGMLTQAKHYIRHYVDPVIGDRLINAIEDTIATIKAAQIERNEK